MDSAVARRIARELALVNSRTVGPHVFHGKTMLPFLVDGDEVEIEPVGFDQIEPGDIVTYRDQQYFPTRRVIRIDRRSRSLIMKGDAIPHLTFFVLEEDVLGRATAFVRDGRRTASSEPEWREAASAIVARERRRARTAWLPDWLGLGPDDSDVPPAAPAPPDDSRFPDAWWRTGRAAIDLDALQVMLALLAGAPERAISLLGRMKARRFLDFTRENGIAGDLVLLAQDQGGGLSAVFDPILGELIESAKKQRAINRAVVAHLHEAAEIFAARGIEPIVLKGPHLSLGYYGSLDQRRMGDLDLLVRRSDLRAASTLLVEAGYASRSGAPLGFAATLRFVHHLEHEKDGVPVDLHHQIRVHPTFRFDEEAMWSTSGRLDLGTRSVRVLSDEYVLVTLLLSIHNDIGLGTADLHAFFDLERVLARAGASLDWEAFFAARRRERTEVIAYNILALYLVLLGGGERHPALLRILESRRGDLALAPDRRAYAELIQGASLAVKKKWAFAQLATSLPAATLWWLVGLPVHALVYRRIFFRNFSERLALRRKTRADRRDRRQAVVDRTEVPIAPGPVGPLAKLGIDGASLPSAVTRPMRLGSFTLELQSDRSFAADTLEELLRLEGTRDDAVAATRAGAPDLRFHVFDATLEETHRVVPAPVRSVVRRDLEGIFEVHHQAASAMVVRPAHGDSGSRGLCGSGPLEVVLALRPASALSATRDTATTPEQMLVHSLMIVFYRVLLELGALHLHAGAVEWNGAASLFLGGKGAGKSTLCLALARACATVLGEDHVLVRRSGDGAGGSRFVVSGCDANMRLTAQTEEALLPEAPSGRMALFGGVVKREFDLRATSFTVRPFTDVQPTRIFFPRVGSRVAITPMPRARAATRILGAIHDRHAIEDAGCARRLLDYVAALVDSLETYELELSPRLSDLDAVVDFVGGRSSSALEVAAPRAPAGRPAPAAPLAAGAGDL